MVQIFELKESSSMEVIEVIDLTNEMEIIDLTLNNSPDVKWHYRCTNGHMHTIISDSPPKLTGYCPGKYNSPLMTSLQLDSDIDTDSDGDNNSENEDEFDEKYECDKDLLSIKNVWKY